MLCQDVPLKQYVALWLSFAGEIFHPGADRRGIHTPCFAARLLHIEVIRRDSYSRQACLAS